MNTQLLLSLFHQNHLDLSNYINTLPVHQFSYSNNGKWTAGQQLSHVHLCLLPITKALAAKEFILQKFGKTDRPAMDYDTVISNYKTALNNGGKAPERFMPEPVHFNDKIVLVDELSEVLNTIQVQLTAYTDEELDTLVLPHPLLGNLTIRELFFLMTYHATHHHEQTKHNLQAHIGFAQTNQ